MSLAKKGLHHFLTLWSVPNWLHSPEVDYQSAPKLEWCHVDNLDNLN